MIDRRLHGGLILLLATTSLGSLAEASKTATIGVRAELLPACTAGSVTPSGPSFGTLDFGTYFALDSSISIAGQAGAGALRINCLTDTPYRVLIGSGQSGSTRNRTLIGPGSAAVRYNLYTGADFATVWDDTTGVSGVGNGQDQWLSVYGRIPAQPVPVAGVYSDSLTITVSW